MRNTLVRPPHLVVDGWLWGAGPFFPAGTFDRGNNQNPSLRSDPAIHSSRRASASKCFPERPGKCWWATPSACGSSALRKGIGIVAPIEETAIACAVTSAFAPRGLMAAFAALVLTGRRSVGRGTTPPTFRAARVCGSKRVRRPGGRFFGSRSRPPGAWRGSGCLDPLGRQRSHPWSPARADNRRGSGQNQAEGGPFKLRVPGGPSQGSR